MSVVIPEFFPPSPPRRDNPHGHMVVERNLEDFARKYIGSLREVATLLEAHLADSFGRHEADQISYAGGVGMTSFDVESAIDELAIDKLDTPTWASHTPVLTAATTNPTLGTGNVREGRYISIGKLVVYQGRIVFGTSGVAAGLGSYRISVPVTIGTGMSDPKLGWVFVYDNSASQQGLMLAAIDGSGFAVFRMVYGGAWPMGASNAVSESLPFAWAASDQLSWNLVYESV